MSTPVLLLLLSLAAARLTRLVNDDEITAPLRGWAVKRWGPSGWIPYMLHCPWCAGIWVSAALCLFAWLTGVGPTLPVALLLIPAVAYGGAIVRSTIEE